MQLPTSHIKDIGGYVFFSNNTTGNSGRPIKIHSDLFLDFFGAVDPTSHDGLTIIRDVESLKVNPKAYRPPSSFQPPQASNMASDHCARLAKIGRTTTAMRHETQKQIYQTEMEKELCISTKNIRLYFHIHQKEGDKAPTAYISEIQVTKENSNQNAGLYEMQASSRGESLKKSDSINLEGKTVFVSGASASPEIAMDNAIDNLRTDKAVLFFNPASVANDLGIWKNNRLTESTLKVIDEMKNVLEKNARKKVAWVVEGEGAAVLAHAIGKVNDTLANHSFKFMNAKTNLPKLLQDLTQKKAQLAGEFIGYTRDKTALLAIASQNQDLLTQIDSLPGNSGYNKIARHHLKGQLKSLGGIGYVNTVLSSPQALRGGSQTFVDALNSAKRTFR